MCGARSFVTVCVCCQWGVGGGLAGAGLYYDHNATGTVTVCVRLGVSLCACVHACMPRLRISATRNALARPHYSVA